MDTFLTIADVTWNWLVSLAHLLQLDMLCNRNSPKWVQSDLRPDLPGSEGLSFRDPDSSTPGIRKAAGRSGDRHAGIYVATRGKHGTSFGNLALKSPAEHAISGGCWCFALQVSLQWRKLGSVPRAIDTLTLLLGLTLYETFQDISILQETCAVDLTPFSLKQMEEPTAKVSLWPIAKAQNISEPCWFAEGQSWWALSDYPGKFWNSDLWLHKFSGISTALKQTLGVGAFSSKDTLNMKNLAEMRSKKKVSDEIVKVMNTLYYVLNE